MTSMADVYDLDAVAEQLRADLLTMREIRERWERTRAITGRAEDRMRESQVPSRVRERKYESLRLALTEFGVRTENAGAWGRSSLDAIYEVKHAISVAESDLR